MVRGIYYQGPGAMPPARTLGRESLGIDGKINIFMASTRDLGY